MNNKIVNKSSSTDAIKSDDSEDLDFSKIFNVLWRGKFTICFMATIAFIFGGIYAFRVAVPVYPASAVIQLKSQQENVVDLQSVVSNNVLTGGWGDQTKLQTEIIAMTSRNLLGKLVDHLGLMDDPQYNPRLRKKAAETNGKNDKSKFSFKALIYNIFSTESSDEKNTVPKETRQETDIAIRNKIVDRLMGLLRVETIGDTYTFRISTKTTSASESVRLVNGLATVYIQDAVDEKFAATERASQWLSTKSAELKIELQEAEQRIKTFSDGTNLINAESLELLTFQLKDLRQRILDLEKFTQETETQYNYLDQEVQSNDMKRIADAAQDVQLDTLALRVGQGQASRDSFDTRAVRILNQLKSKIERSNKQLEALVASETSLQNKIASQSDDLVELQQLKRDTQASGLLYESFVSRLKEISVQQGLLSPISRMLSPATPQRKSAPQRSSIMMLSFALGGILGGLLLLLREFMNKTFRSPEDLEAATNLRLLGTIPLLKSQSRSDVLKYALDNPSSAFAEAVRNLRTTILLSDIDNPPQVIMSTSSMPGEGKTTLSLTLAQNMAGLSKKILVLECDIRKRTFMEYFDIRSQLGFITVMTGEAKLKDVVYRPKGMEFDVLIGEKSSANAADIFSSQKFGGLINELRECYDYIIIDTPPVLAVPDARVIAQHVDTVIYSVRWDKTQRAELKNGLAMFDSVSMPVDGLVMMQLNTKQMKRYGYTGSYGYHYGGGISGYNNG